MARPLDDVLSFHGDLTDAVTGLQVTSRTKLVDLRRHLPRPHTFSGRLLNNLTGIATPGTRCILVIDETPFPHSSQRTDHAEFCTVSATFEALLTAPAVRVELRFPELDETAAIKFHFNTLDNGLGITDFGVVQKYSHTGRRDDMATFRADGVTVEGFNKPAIKNLQIINDLRALLDKSKAPKYVKLPFSHPLTSLSPLMALLPYVKEDSPLKLSSLSSGEWSQLLPHKPERDLTELMYGPNPYPMVTFDCGDTYSTIPTAIAQLYESSRIVHVEQEVQLEEWASVNHNGTLYKVGGIVVMAVRFAPTRPLGGPSGVVKFDVPDRLRLSMSWNDPMTGEAFMADGSRSSMPLRLPMVYDMLVIVARPTDRMREACLGRNDADIRFMAQVKFAATLNKGPLRNQLMTALNLEHAFDWHQLVLNQRHDLLPVVDLAVSRLPSAHEDPTLMDTVDQAFEWMLNWRKWNPEQLEALHSVRNAAGRVVMITGPAGTGKTLLIQALTVFFYSMGLHVMVMAPANSNCADFMRKLTQLFPPGSKVLDHVISATRIFPPSTDFSPEKEAKGHESLSGAACGVDNVENLAENTVSSGSSSTIETSSAELFDFELVRSELSTTEDKYGEFKDFGLAQQVLKAARIGEETLMETLGRGDPVNVWQVLRSCMDEAEAGTFNWKDKKAVLTYQRSYEACKAHFLARQRLVVTTTGNVRCEDLVNNFASGKHNTPCNGMVIILDEACKDREIDTLSALLYPEWRTKVTGFIMLGDDAQLEPTNMSAKGAVVFNQFGNRASVPVLSKNKREGMRCNELKEQHRMNAHISAWPSKNFYTGMRDGPGTNSTLQDKRPGLFTCLKNILTSIGSGVAAIGDKIEQDKYLRTQYLEVLGTRDNTKRSAVVREHVKFFFDRVFWHLHAYYGEKLEESVMVIIAYKGAKNAWLDAAMHIQRKYKLPSSQLPRILTIDSSQGAEAQVTIVDCSVQKYSWESHGRDIGFCDDDKRINVCMTRAQEVRWILGGSCNGSRPMRFTTPAYVRYKDEVTGSSEVTTTGNRMLRHGEQGWLESLTKQDVQLNTRYSDEAES